MTNPLFCYISSRNNYEMLESEVLKNVNFGNFKMVNVDDNSSEEQKKIGRKICKENNVFFIENNGRGLFMAADTAIKWIKSNFANTKYAYWLTHDCYPLGENFFEKLSNIISSGSLDDFGVVGFNTIWKKFSFDKSHFLKNNLFGKYCGTMGRAVLTKVPGAGWYRSSDFEMTWDVWGKNIAAESVVDMNLMINIERYSANIIPDPVFRHFCWGDDLCFQFLRKDICNITLGSFYVYHDQSLKSKYKIPENSLRAAEKGDTFHFCSPTDHLQHWKMKWGFDRDWQKNDKLKSPKQADASISDCFFSQTMKNFVYHDYRQGPIRTFDYV